MKFQSYEAQMSGAQLSGAQLSGGSTVERLNCRGLICRGSTVGAHLSGAQLSGHHRISTLTSTLGVLVSDFAPRNENPSRIPDSWNGHSLENSFLGVFKHVGVLKHFFFFLRQVTVGSRVLYS